ncbi:MAG: hypothetical protein WCG25_04135 [bacterium]
MLAIVISAHSVGSHIQYRNGCSLSGEFTLAVESKIPHIKKCFQVFINSSDTLTLFQCSSVWTNQFGSYHDHVIS